NILNWKDFLRLLSLLREGNHIQADSIKGLNLAGILIDPNMWLYMIYPKDGHKLVWILIYYSMDTNLLVHYNMGMHHIQMSQQKSYESNFFTLLSQITHEQPTSCSLEQREYDFSCKREQTIDPELFTYIENQIRGHRGWRLLLM
ncbi:hypothetical protein ACJX0J_029168, partial [Zea mays]